MKGKTTYYRRALHSEASDYERAGWRGVAMHVIDSIPEGGALFEIDELPPDEVQVKEDKDRWSLLPWDAMRSVVKVFTAGVKVHGATAYRDREGVVDESFDAAMRHLAEYQCGKRIDEETKQPPVANAIARLLIVLCHELQRKD